MKMDNPEEVFRSMQSETLCPFAKVARFDFARIMGKGMTLTEGVDQLHQDMIEYVQSSMDDASDGLVVAIEKDILGDTFDEQVHGFHALYRALKACDGVSEDALAYEDISDPGWQLTVYGTRFFTNFFSSTYPENNSRHVPESDLVFLFFQPEQSFSLRIPYDIGSDELARLKTGIRTRFASAGLAYEGTITDDPREAAKYILPRQMGEKVVEWWYE